MNARWNTVKVKAAEVRKKYAVKKPRVNAFEIASREGIKIAYFNPAEKTQNIAGLLDKEAETIYLNTDDSPERQNFTLAHELAHYFLDHKPNEYGVNWRNTQYLASKPGKEREADCFAAELLMPAGLIRKIQKELELQDDDTIALSRVFGVSNSAMKYRLQSLKNARE